MRVKPILWAGNGGKGTGSSSLPQRRRLRGPTLLHCHRFFHPPKPPQGIALYSSPRTKVPPETLKQQKPLHALRQRCLSRASATFFSVISPKGLRITQQKEPCSCTATKSFHTQKTGPGITPVLSRTAWQLGEDCGSFSKSAS